MSLLKELESKPIHTETKLEEVLSQLNYNDQHLLPVVAQDHHSKEVLMLAWMDETAIRNTLSDGRVCYFSRSRQKYWRKGEESGHTQRLKEMYVDCDGDSILILVSQNGPACHTNRQSCFYLYVNGNTVTITTAPTQ